MMRGGGRVTLPGTLLALSAALFLACTPETQPPTPPSPTASCDVQDPACAIVLIEVDGTEYKVECRPVAEALVDVELGRDGGRSIRAIAGVASTQGAAVQWRDPSGCGLFVLALATDLSQPVGDLIREEVARGVERFGVTASPVPRSEPGD